MAAKPFSRFASTTVPPNSGSSPVTASSPSLRELKYVEIPVDLSQSIKFSQINVESHKISCDPAYFIAALISPLKSLCPVAAPTDFNSTSPLSRASTLLIPDWNTVVPFPTFNECSSPQVPLFFSKRYPEPMDSKLKNLRADKLLECFADKLAKRKSHFYGPVVVFWRKSVDEERHSMKLSDFTLEHIKRAAPSILLPAAKQMAPRANGSYPTFGTEYPASLTSHSESPATLSPRPTQNVPNKQSAWSGSLPLTHPTPAVTVETDGEQTDKLLRVVRKFLGNIGAELPEVTSAFENLSVSDDKLRERIQELEEELKEIKIKNDICVNEVILARRETERCRELALADRETLRLLQADYDLLKEKLQSLETSSISFKKQSDVSSVWGKNLDAQRTHEATPASEHQDAYLWSKGISFLDNHPEPTSGNSISFNGPGFSFAEKTNDGNIEEAPSKTEEKWFVTEVYNAEVPETSDNTMWGTFEEGEIVTVQEKTPGGWWYIIGIRGQRGWYPEAFLLPVQSL